MRNFLRPLFLVKEFDKGKLYQAVVGEETKPPGKNTGQDERDADYRDPSNLQILCGQCNQSKGGDHFNPVVGPNFRGKPDNP